MDPRTTDQALAATRGGGFLMTLAAGALLASSVAAVWASPAGAAEDSFPLTVVDDEGTAVTIEAEPQRIVSLSPANTEIVFALGAGERMVGRTDYDDYPPEAAELTPVATFNGVSMEQVVALEPDLVLAGGGSFTNPEDVSSMRELGYPVVVTYPSDVPGVYEDIELIGLSIGEAAAAEVLTADMAEQIASIASASAASGEAPRTFYQVDSVPEIYGPADDSFLADMVALGGGDPVTSGDAVAWSIPVERLVEADPEVILVGDALWGVCPNDVAARPGWDAMSAVRDGNVRSIGFVDVTRPGPRLPEAIAAIALAIDPGLVLDGYPVHPDPCAAD